VILQEVQPAPGDEPQRRVAQGKVKSGTHFVSLDLKNTPDGTPASVDATKDFFVLALIAGFRPLFGQRKPHP
jgi:hypothetical protein